MNCNTIHKKTYNRLEHAVEMHEMVSKQPSPPIFRDREGGKRIADNALVAMTLMIAESRPQEKAVITAMLTNLISNGK